MNEDERWLTGECAGPNAELKGRRYPSALNVELQSMELLTDAEIAGYMNWRVQGAYNAHAMKRLKMVIEEAAKREREACAKICDPGEDENNDLDPPVFYAMEACAREIRERSNAELTGRGAELSRASEARNETAGANSVGLK